MSCANCGKEIGNKAVICVYCRYDTINSSASDKKHCRGAGVAVFFGYTDAHGFYSGLINSALATLLLCILGWLLIIDFIGLLFPALLALRRVAFALNEAKYPVA